MLLPCLALRCAAPCGALYRLYCTVVCIVPGCDYFFASNTSLRRSILANHSPCGAAPDAHGSRDQVSWLVCRRTSTFFFSLSLACPRASSSVMTGPLRSVCPFCRAHPSPVGPPGTAACTQPSCPRGELARVHCCFVIILHGCSSLIEELAQASWSSEMRSSPSFFVGQTLKAPGLLRVD